MPERELKIINMDKINEQIENGEVEGTSSDPNEVLYETLLDLLQLAEAEGMTEHEVDAVVHRVNEYRADKTREKWRLS